MRISTLPLATVLLLAGVSLADQESQSAAGRSDVRVRAAADQESQYADGRFEVTWRVTGAGASARVDGRIVNRHGFAVYQIVFAVESLDGEGRVVGTSVGFVDATVPENDSREFSLRARILPGAKGVRLRPVSWRTLGGA
jgi:hypothetical protein